MPDIVTVAVKASEIDKIYPLLESGIKCLSLDFFDTLMWRKAVSPIDIFYTLQEQPTFKSLGFSARMRIESEDIARTMQYCRSARYEVNLEEIYRAFMPDLTDEQLSLLAKEEVENDISNCYPFVPIINLIDEAYKRKLKIIITSDTYYRKAQFKGFLERYLPPETIAKISNIFCSCEYGVSKSRGLFGHVLQNMKLKPNLFLHLGDNMVADLEYAHRAGMHSVHLVRSNEEMEHLNRMQTVALSYLDQTVRHKRSLDLPLKGFLSQANINVGDAEKMFGFSALGPILYAFSQFIQEQITKIASREKSGDAAGATNTGSKNRTKILFLMRDGYLPFLSLQELNGESFGHCVRISRFAANAASFENSRDIDRYLAKNVFSLRFKDLCKQLLLPEDISEPLIQSVESAKSPESAFINAISKKSIINTIIGNSQQYRKRLFKHLQNSANVEPGDTIVFVDLGYSGTVQTRLQSIFKKEYNIDIFGIYLIALGIPGWQSNRCGLLDPSNYDERALQTLVAYIALLEQVCTNSESSVIDYKENGEPIFSETVLNAQQHLKLRNIQNNCLQFVSEAKRYLHESQLILSSSNLRDIAVAALGRMLYFPTEQELAYLKSFQFDLNLGTDDLIDLFDEEKGLTGLIRRGLFFIEFNLNTMRTNYPAELRYASIGLASMLMASHRFGLDMRYPDFSLRRESIVIAVMSLTTGEVHNTTIKAAPTYDGYFALNIPAGKNAFQICIKLGLSYEWVQVESAELIQASYLLSSQESEFTVDIADRLAFQDMVDHGNGLFECITNSAGLTYVPDNTTQPDENQLLRIVFRPISKRTGSP